MTNYEKAVIDSIIKNLCYYSGKTLESFTHSEAPWLKTRGDLSVTAASNRTIHKKVMGDYFAAVKEHCGMNSLRIIDPLILPKYDAEQAIDFGPAPEKEKSYTLHEAMRIVLSDAEDKTMHASKLADEIYDRKLYSQKNGKKAQYTQIRAGCGHYPDMFEALPGNHIKLKERVE